jgi:hypothetical protein
MLRLVCAFIAVFVAYAHAWGPLTHQLFSCAFVSPFNCSDVNGAFVLGAFSPDAIKKTQPLLHSFDYGTFQLEAAFSSSAPAAFDAVSFSQVCGGFSTGFFSSHTSLGMTKPHFLATVRSRHM